MAETDRMIQVAGKDVDAAIAAGLARLGVDRDAVEVEVLDEGRQGLFGLGGRAARVRLTVTSPPVAGAPSESRRSAAAERGAPERPAPSLGKPGAPPAAEPVGPSLAAGEEQAEAARGVMEDVLGLMGMGEARVDVRRAKPGPDGDKVPPLVLDVRGPATETLIGRSGETLAALQHITRLIVGREMRAWVHLVVDVQGYKASRAKSLRRQAHRKAEQAVLSNHTVVLESMPPHERRVVHVALYDDNRVTTQSIGEGDRRRVTIIPQDE